MRQGLITLKGARTLFSKPPKLFVFLSVQRFSNEVADFQGEGYVFFFGNFPDPLIQGPFRNNVDTWISGWHGVAR